MVQTVTIDIINDKALRLLQDLELLQLIRVRRPETTTPPAKWSAQHKGSMRKQPLEAVDAQLEELRNGWE